MQPQLLQEHLPVLRLHLGKLLLDLAADGHHTAALRLGYLQHLPVKRVLIQVARKIGLAEVCHIDDRLIGKQRAIGDELFFFLSAGKIPGGFALAQPLVQPFEERCLGQRLFIAALGCLFAAVDPPFYQVNVGEHQLQVDGLNIPRRANLAADMDDLAVIKAAHHMDDGIHLANMGKELVAQALALGGPLHQPRDIHELDDRGSHLIGGVHLTQLIQPGIRYRHDAHIRFDGAEGIVGSPSAAAGQGVEYGALANIRQADDS